MIVKEEINTKGADDQRQKGGDVADEIDGDVGQKKKGSEEDTGKVGGVGHTAQKARSAVFLPDGEKGAAEVFLDIKLGVKVVPAGEKSAGFVVEKDQKTGEKKESNDWPDAAEIFAKMAEFSKGETVFCFSNVFGHKLV